jgi:Phosphomannose isomerase
MKTPIKFQPILKQRVWGGTRLLSKASAKVNLPIGESWEIADLPDNSNIITTGKYAGKTFHEMFTACREYLLGDLRKAVDDDFFPLMLKLLDSADDLSLQVHPDDSVAQRHHGKTAKGKHEAWFILEAMPEAEFYYGLASPFTKDSFLDALKNGNFDIVYNTVQIKAGDYIDVPPGTIHGIGKGVLLAEIQEASDITYRLYDWNRQPARKLHIDEALDSIVFIQNKMDAFSSVNAFSETGDLCLLKNDKFTVDRLWLRENEPFVKKTLDRSFHIVLPVEGAIEIEAAGESMVLKNLETCLVPAAAGCYTMLSRFSRGSVLVFTMT